MRDWIPIARRPRKNRNKRREKDLEIIGNYISNIVNKSGDISSHAPALHNPLTIYDCYIVKAWFDEILPNVKHFKPFDQKERIYEVIRFYLTIMSQTHRESFITELNSVNTISVDSVESVYTNLYSEPPD